ncbi:PREDICTED: prostaglandin reductase 1-like isoform X2 [Amphimedon queenslandica]|uniref:Prostaglandin reductase 1 n=1 Tax=Amphimedon queenslandica TaxID=400682 RepID=A0AAN0JFQ9_AMPQE|nr:PREDICTED: prostaglandin reductase 1-like isoform X2 [Amphimedon queenslandica]|eukprot:XP_019855478.1 PREDICTED: prostaglandin reductase 1-like isoform X2 [Amphimedon queenslandica]
MSGVKARSWIKVKEFVGLPKRDDFEIVEKELPALKDGEFLVEGLWNTVDPYMRSNELSNKLGSPMPGGQVAKVTQSKDKNFAVGDVVLGPFGWTSHSICDGPASLMKIIKLDPTIPLPQSTALGILGMPGATSYFGLLDICKPIKEGETLLVNAAAGAVGSAVGQIGKIKGMRVVGFAGSDEKVAYLKSLGFDAAYNYKTIPSLEAAIKESCPNGVDAFFDNVGGDFFDTVLRQMNTFGRVSVCGAISQYNALEPRKGIDVSSITLIVKQLKIEGFIVTRWLDQWQGAFKEMAQWIQEGKLKYRETVFEGFDSMYDAFVSLFKGDNIGKVVVKI